MHVVLYFEYIGSFIGIVIVASHALETQSWFWYAQQSKKNLLYIKIWEYRLVQFKYKFHGIDTHNYLILKIKWNNFIKLPSPFVSIAKLETSWATNWPHCISSWLFLSRILVCLFKNNFTWISLALGNGIPSDDVRNFEIPLQKTQHYRSRQFKTKMNN